MRTKQVADRLGKHENTVRNYAQQFAEFLSPAPPKGEYRDYTDDDVRVLHFVAQLSDKSMRIEDIKSTLRHRLDEGTSLPPVIPPVSPVEKQGLVTVPEMETQLALKDAQLRELQIRMEELRRELTELKTQQRQERTDHRDELSRISQQYMQQVVSLSEEIGRLKAELRAKGQGWQG